MSNFKSYAGKQVLGPFHPRFSSVIGPNGSGKSNIVDAMLFVLGGRAQAMRQPKLQALIHKSEVSSDCTFCSVEIIFHYIRDVCSEQGERSAEVETLKTFSVSRIVTRGSSGSQYRIDDNPSSRDEVNALLASYGVDVTNHRLLILQGEVERLSQLKPRGQKEGETGMLEYLEEVTGSSQFAGPIEEAGQNAQLADEAWDSADKQFDNQLNAALTLMPKRDEAAKWLSSEIRVLRATSLLAQTRAAQSVAEQQRAEAEAKKLQERAEAEQEKIKELMDEYKKAEADAEEKRRELREIRVEADQVSAQFDELTRKDTAIREAGSQARDRAQRLVAQADKAEADATRFEDQARKAQLKSDHAREGLGDIEERLEAAKTELAQELQRQEALLSGPRQRVAKAGELLTKTTQQLNQARALLDRIQAAEQAQEMYASASEERRRSQEEYKQASTTASQARRDWEAAQRAVTEATRSLETEQQNLNAATERRSAAMAAMDELRDQAATGLAGKLLHAQEIGEISGILGRIGDLCMAHQDLRYVLAAAAGRRLDAIVVQSVESAQDAVKYLREHHLGTAQFAVLQQLSSTFASQSQDSRLWSDSPPDISVATQRRMPITACLVVPQNLRPAVAWAIGSGCLVSSLSEALAMPRRDTQMVALDGTVLQTSGSIVGGGNPDDLLRGNGGVRSLDGRQTESRQDLRAAAQAELDAASALVAQAERSVQEAQQHSQAAQDTLRSATTRLQDAKCSEREAEMQLKQRQLDEVQAKNAAEMAPQPAIGRSDAQERYDAAQVAEAEARQAVQAANEAMQAAAGERASELTAEVSQLTEELTQRRRDAEQGAKDADRLMAKAAAQREQVPRLREQAEQADKEMKAALQEMEQITAQAEKCLHERDSWNQSLSEAQQASETAERELERLGKDNSQARLTIDKLIASSQEAVRQSQKAQHASTTALQLVDQLDEQYSELAKEFSPEIQDALTQHSDTQGESQIPLMPAFMRESLTQSFNDLPLEPLLTALPRYGKDILDDLNTGYLDEIVTKEKATAQELGASGPGAILLQWRECVEHLRGLESKVNEASQVREAARSRFEQLRSERLRVFLHGFNIIRSALQTTYRSLTLGGNAELELVDQRDPFADGVSMSVMPPHKTWRAMSQLSGGERTLASLALILAMHSFRPTPFYFLDEIDAALDYRNVAVVAHTLRERIYSTPPAQLIVVSLNNNMFELADRLVGVFKPDGVTRVVTVDPGAVVSRAKEKLAEETPQQNHDESICAEINQ